MYDVKVLEIKINIIVLATADRPVTKLEHERIRYMCVGTVGIGLGLKAVGAWV